MIPLPWLKLAPYIACVILLMALIGVWKMYSNERDQFLIFKTSVKTLGEDAERRNKAQEDAAKDNLQKVKDDHETQVPKIEANAVAAYRAAHPNRLCKSTSSSGSMSPNSTGIQVDDGIQSELVLDEATIKQCAIDAEKIEAWRDYCTRNHCPIEE